MAVEYAKFVGNGPSFVRALHRDVSIGEKITDKAELDIIQAMPDNAVKKMFELHEKKDVVAPKKKEG